MNGARVLQRVLIAACLCGLLLGCVPPDLPAPLSTALPARLPAATATLPPTVVAVATGLPTSAPSPAARADGLSAAQVATLSSLRKVDDYPLYTMRYFGAYEEREAAAEPPAGERSVDVSSILSWSPVAASSQGQTPWACSLFAALGDAGGLVYGRNFDWEFSPALLLFGDPPGGYASVSMVDIAYFGFDGDEAQGLLDLPLAALRSLLGVPQMPFDGMNERGLAVGMAAVPPGQMEPDPDKETIGSLRAIREALDHAANVDEAVAVVGSFNIDMGGGPPLHYLIADASGRGVLVEFYEGEMVVIPSEESWLQATNFLRSSVVDSPEGQCHRYDRMSERLSEARGKLPAREAMDLLSEVAQGNTQWSVVYGMSSGVVGVVMGRHYEALHSFHLRTGGEH